MPSLYLIDASGVVRMIRAGYTETSIGDLERMLRELLDRPP
jgi:hypothetical protein